MSFVRPIALSPARPLLSLPPALRLSIYHYQHHQPHPAQHAHKHGVRHFSVGTVFPHATHMYNTGHVVYPSDWLALIPAEIMHHIHDTLHLSWWAVLPLSALVFRSLFVYPIFQKQIRKKQVQRLAIRPLVNAKMSSHKFKSRFFKDQPSVRKVFLTAQNIIYTAQSSSAVYGHGIFLGSILLHRLGMFACLLVASDTIRKLSGFKEGLLRTLLSPINGLFISPSDDKLESASPSTSPALATNFESDSTSSPSSDLTLNTDIQPNDTSPHISTWSTDIDPQSPSSASFLSTNLQPTSPSLPTDLPTDSPWFDPAMLTEGLPWCPDLTVADPTFILPILFSASWFAIIYYSPRVKSQGKGRPEGGPTNGQRIGMTLAFLSIIPAIHMPAALLLYLIPNIWIGALQSRWLLFTMPFTPSPTACSRPVRSQPLQELRDEFSKRR